jgi:hypothetical protein
MWNEIIRISDIRKVQKKIKLPMSYHLYSKQGLNLSGKLQTDRYVFCSMREGRQGSQHRQQRRCHSVPRQQPKAAAQARGPAAAAAAELHVLFDHGVPG